MGTNNYNKYFGRNDRDINRGQRQNTNPVDTARNPVSEEDKSGTAQTIIYDELPKAAGPAHSDNFSGTSPETELSKEEIKAIVANCKHLNVREKDNKSAKIICVIEAGTIVCIEPIDDVNIDDAWAHIRLEDGIIGYVMGEYLKEA